MWYIARDRNSIYPLNENKIKRSKLLSHTRRSASNCRPFLFETDKLPDGLYRAFVKMEGEVAGEGFGDTAKLAQREAARFVLDKLELSPVPGADLQTKPPKVEDMIAGMFQVDIDMLSHDISLISL